MDYIKNLTKDFIDKIIKYYNTNNKSFLIGYDYISLQFFSENKEALIIKDQISVNNTLSTIDYGPCLQNLKNSG
jgi:hypothetical protein